MSAPKRTPVKAVAACLRNRALPPPEGKPLQDKPTWPGPPSAPPVESTPRSDNNFKRKKSDREFDANHFLNPRERIVIEGMKDYLGRRESILVAVGKLESYLVAPSDVVGIITVMAETACDGGGYRRFLFINSWEGNLVASARQHAALQENLERDHKELQEAIEFMNVKQSRLLATMV